MSELSKFYLGTETACPGASKIETFILLQLVFELELFKPPMAFQFWARKPVSHDRFFPKFALRMIHMCAIEFLNFWFLPFAVSKL